MSKLNMFLGAAAFSLPLCMAVMGASAQQPAPVASAFVGKASDRQVADFRADKASLLKIAPTGGAQMSSLVKALVLADPSLADDLLALAKIANKPQAAAIGAGIGQAVAYLNSVDRALSVSIAQKVASAGQPDVLAGYTIGSSDIRTLAVSSAGGPGGGAAPGGGVGGPVGGLSNSYYGGSSRTYGVAGTFSNPNNTVSISSTKTFAGASVTCTTSVSPYRSC